MSPSNVTEEIRLDHSPTDAQSQHTSVPEQQALNANNQDAPPAAAAAGARNAVRNALDGTMSYCAGLKGDVLRLRGWSRLLAIGVPSLLLLVGIVVLAVVLAADKQTTDARPQCSNNGTTTPPRSNITTTNSTVPDTDECTGGGCTISTSETVTEIMTTPTPEQSLLWFARGPLVDMEELASWAAVEARLDADLDRLKMLQLEGLFLARLADFSAEAAGRCSVVSEKVAPMRIIADVNTFVDTTHDWFNKSEQMIDGYDDYFVWKTSPKDDPPNNWTNSWGWSDERKMHYLQLSGSGTANLNLANSTVRAAARGWLSSWAAGCNLTAIRLKAIRSMWLEDAVNKSSPYNQAGDELKAELLEWKKNLSSAGVELFTVDDDIEGLQDLKEVVQLPRADFEAKNHYDDGERKLRLLKTTAADKKAVALQIKEVGERWTWIEEAWLTGLLSPFVPIFTWRQFNVTDKKGRVEVWNKALEIRTTLQNGQYQYDLKRYGNEIVFTRVLEDKGYVVVMKADIVDHTLNLTELMPRGQQQDLRVEIISNTYENGGGTLKVNETVSSSELDTYQRSVLVLSFPV